MADIINVTIKEPEKITVRVIEAEPIKVTVNERTPTEVATIFNPPDGGKRITKIFWKDGKFHGEYEDEE